MASGFQPITPSVQAEVADINEGKADLASNPSKRVGNSTDTGAPTGREHIKFANDVSYEQGNGSTNSQHFRHASEDTLVDPNNPPGDNSRPGSEKAESTFSHTLAEDYDPTQLDDDQKVQNYGLKAGKDAVDHDYQEPEQVLGTLTKEDFWLLLRRFNKQIQYVKAIEKAPPGDLDLVMSREEIFEPDKLRAQLERLYMTVVIGSIGVGTHIIRLRSWKETKRTAWFCTTYFVAWYFNLIMAAFFTMMVALIAYPKSRHFLFPPMAKSLVDKRTGDLQTPASGSLGSKDSATGAPEKHRGEAVEQEAFNFASGFATLVVSTVTGEHPVEDTTESGDVKGSAGLDRSSIVAQAADTKAAAVGLPKDAKNDRTKQPMEAMIWSKASPAMRGIATLCDIWERFENLLSPTPPFPKTPRNKLAGSIAPLVLVYAFVNSSIFVKATGFAFGAAFFGQPGIDRALEFLNTRYPNWMEAIDIRNTVLLHVPTNAQLTLTLLRIGESKNAPLPPPPREDEAPDEDGPETPMDESDLPIDVSNAEVQRAVNPDPQSMANQNEVSQDDAREKHPHRSKLMRFLKGTTKGGVETQVATDVAKASVGSKHARHRIGALSKNTEDAHTAVEFKARYDGGKGYAVITSAATTPCVAFSKHSNKNGLADLKPVWSIPIAEIKGLKKVGSYGWKAKLVVGWAMDREVADGIEIEDKQGNKRVLTAMPGRDELFNRLIAADGHLWECY